jgi:hypothetical protein
MLYLTQCSKRDHLFFEENEEIKFSFGLFEEIEQCSPCMLNIQWFGDEVDKVLGEF